MSDPKRPIGSFIFLGPTGVGKTELARALAEFLFDDEHALLRIDMSEYMEKHSVARLIGAPPGYVGYEEGGQLTEQVRRRPYAVVLFDEIEKAHPDVFNILLQMMDDGRLTDGKGRVVDFKNTILIMTSNIGSQFLQSRPHPGGPAAQISKKHPEQVMNQLHSHFRPEFLNRVDDIIVFHPLGKEQLVKIVDLRLEDLRRLLADRKISLELTDSAKDLLFTQGYDPNFGARPLKRAIQKFVQDPLALKILDGEVLHGDHVVVDADKKSGKMKFEVSKRVGRERTGESKTLNSCFLRRRHPERNRFSGVSEIPPPPAEAGTKTREFGMTPFIFFRMRRALSGPAPDRSPHRREPRSATRTRANAYRSSPSKSAPPARKSPEPFPTFQPSAPIAAT